ncbi:T9SS type B sorting domain-containing protein [Polaribacter sp. SA4-12]|uniref:T9SS type B sorting domain-containing protein n=1 Tax=Polaribacter sp. SA4-12 TaxID=1312072 RepID=UPI000B3C64A5|nr:T9SS type B sorting domain-containing protein [Polaribacter sp. SA4-12]ARV13765.1 hypothetical protein BTO07_00790 [Polaribacter sp. SA4-12]
MKKILLLILSLYTSFLFSQNDCTDALIVCGNNSFTDLDATGVGIQELNSSNTCNSQEHNSLWFKIKIKTGGTLGFILTPTNDNGTTNTDIVVDFDFFIFGKNVTCDNIGQAIRCSTTNPQSSNQADNLTGMNSTETDTSEGPGADGNSFVKELEVEANDSYFIVIDRPIGSSNFKIDWTGTATLGDPPVANPPVTGTTYNLEECDDNLADTEETSIFDLITNQDTLIGSQTNVNISYHLSANDAQTNTNPILSTTTYRNITNPQVIFTRLTNTNNGCFTTNNFTLNVKTTFNINTPEDYLSCDDNTISSSNTDGYSSSFLLESKDSEILETLDSSLYTVSYHKSLSDAENNSAAIDKALFYTNTIKDNEKIFVRVINNTGCRNTSKTFNLVVNPVPEINAVLVYEQCDFDDNPNDFVTNFNLTTKESEIYTGTDDVVIDFFETTDTSFTSPLIKNNYRNSTATNATNGDHKLIVKVTNPITSCYQIKEIELKVNPSGISSYPDVYACELDSNANIPDSRNSIGSNTSFYDFDIKTQEIISKSGGALKLTTHNFSYYRTSEDAGLQNNEITAPFDDDFFTDEEDIFIRITLKASNSCESIGQFKIQVQKIPVPQGNLNPEILCINNPIDTPQLKTIDLNADTGINTDTYKWYLNNQLIIGETSSILKANIKGEYKVETLREYTNDPTNNLDNFICVGYNTFTVVESNIAVIESFDFVDDQDMLEENTITINVSGKGNYEYALNSNNITDFKTGINNLSYTFTNVPTGLNKIYIRDINDCGETISKEISFIYFQRHFTPNADGKFDTWKVLGTDNTFYKQVSLEIFDRFGNLLKVMDQKTENGWNGFLNGKPLPSNDYWYNAVLVDINGNIRTKNGHFSLLRR